MMTSDKIDLYTSLRCTYTNYIPFRDKRVNHLFEANAEMEFQLFLRICKL